MYAAIVFGLRTIGGWDRETYGFRNGGWRCIGREIVSHVDLENVDGVVGR